jgi:CheY-like chemotaxis protein
MAAMARARIMLINDDRPFLALMHQLLEAIEGYEVLICMEGDQAYEFVKQHRPDLVILDIRMGGEEIGWTILQLLTLDPATRPIPLLVCSAAIHDLQAHEPLLQGYGVDILPKPFDLEVLLAKVQAGLDERSR